MQTLYILKPEFHAEMLCQRRMFLGAQMDFSAALHDLINKRVPLLPVGNLIAQRSVFLMGILQVHWNIAFDFWEGGCYAGG